MNELLKWALILAGGYFVYSKFVLPVPDTGATPTPMGGGTPAKPDLSTATPIPMTPAQKAEQACADANAYIAQMSRWGAVSVSDLQRLPIDPGTCSLPRIPSPEPPIADISITNAPPNFNQVYFTSKPELPRGMSGNRNYVRRGTLMRTR